MHKSIKNLLSALLCFSFVIITSCGKNDDKEQLPPSVSCPQAATGVLLRGETVSVNISGIAKDTEVTVRFGKETTLGRKGPGVVSYAFEDAGSQIVSVTMKPAEVKEQTYSFQVAQLVTIQRLAEKLLQDPKLCLVMTHRANSSDWSIPENSLPAIEKSIADKVDIVENDLWTTKDGVLVVSHDATLDRETNGSGKIADKTLAQIKSLFLKDRNGKVTKEKMLTFDEYLDACKGHIYVNVDLGDRDANIPDVLGAIAKKHMSDQVLVYCNTVEKIQTAFRLNPECNVYSWVNRADALVSKGIKGHHYFTQCTWNPTTGEASRTGAVNSSKTPTAATTVASALSAGTILTVNAIYTLNTAQFWPKDFKKAQVEDIMKTFPACRCIHVDTGAEARSALAAAGYHLLNE